MHERLLFRHRPTARFAPPGERAPSAPHTPWQNRLLAALPQDEYLRLLPRLEPLPLPAGETIYGAGHRERHVYFVTAGIVARFCMTESGALAESAVTGNEGAIGVASVLGGESTPGQAVALTTGHAYRLNAAAMQDEFKLGGVLLRVLLRYVQALIVQTGQTAVCNRHHSVEQQLARWLLLSLDRLPSNELAMTQELIANMLGVRREGVTEAASKLQAAGMIRYCRGRITALDRPKLEKRVCECYAVVKKEYDRLLEHRIAG